MLRMSLHCQRPLCCKAFRFEENLARLLWKVQRNDADPQIIKLALVCGLGAGAVHTNPVLLCSVRFGKWNKGLQCLDGGHLIQWASTHLLNKGACQRCGHTNHPRSTFFQGVTTTGSLAGAAPLCAARPKIVTRRHSTFFERRNGEVREECKLHYLTQRNRIGVHGSSSHTTSHFMANVTFVGIQK